MASESGRNDFLVDLLALQQDGKQAISAPTNWTTQEPLLEVWTEIDDIVEELGTSILLDGNRNKPARWHFFIGSPGNGKSAAMGKLCRYLLQERGCQIKDEQGCPIQELQSTAVPYALDVYEGDNKYVSARIVQDASVVRNPFSPNVDPGSELVSTLQDAWRKGISLIICTNRGVLEKAHRDNHTNGEVNKEPWFKILASIVQSTPTIREELEREWDFRGRKPVFPRVKITYSHLDNRSLLLGKDIFDRLIQKAVDPVHWEACSKCSVKDLCPFKGNRDWLHSLSGREKFLAVLRRAEAFSGQIIVFREALALISLILAGCPRDYGNDHPCTWVKGKAESGDVFSLASRRIYMSLFASFAPFGLEPTPSLRKRQIDAFRRLEEEIRENGQEFKAILGRVIRGQPPSTDVGTTRLLDEEGILAQIDPCRESLPSSFWDIWDGDYRLIQENDNPLLTTIERRCAEVWAFLEQAMESIHDHTVFEAHWALRRWGSNFLLHLGALIEGRTAWAKELDEFLQLLEVAVKPPESRSIEEKRSLRELDERLEALLDTASNGRREPGSVQLSEAVTLLGRWVRDKLKPRTVASEQSGSLTLSVEFEGGERATLGAPMFLWLSRRARGKLDPRCFPPELLAGAVDARIRAAAKGKYAFEDNDVELVIASGRDEIFRLVRLDGEVDVRHERTPVCKDSE